MSEGNTCIAKVNLEVLPLVGYNGPFWDTNGRMFAFFKHVKTIKNYNFQIKPFFYGNKK